MVCSNVHVGARACGALRACVSRRGFAAEAGPIHGRAAGTLPPLALSLACLSVSLQSHSSIHITSHTSSHAHDQAKAPVQGVVSPLKASVSVGGYQPPDPAKLVYTHT